MMGQRLATDGQAIFDARVKGCGWRRNCMVDLSLRFESLTGELDFHMALHRTPDGQPRRAVIKSAICDMTVMKRRIGT